MSSSRGSDTRDEGTSPSELAKSCQDELDYYTTLSKTLPQGQWISPPDPRRSIRRSDKKHYNREMAISQKRWSTVSMLFYGQGVSYLRDTDIKQPHGIYKLGTVFSAPFHTSSTVDEAYVLSDDPNLTASPFGTICSKYRKMVVVNTFAEHCTVLPIYTHNGRGLDGKEFVDEFVSIRDRNDRRPAPKEGPYAALHAVRDATFKGTFIGGRACVKLTEICSHRYDCMATFEGRLEEDSIKRLLDLLKVVTQVSTFRGSTLQGVSRPMIEGNGR